jgi:hypothetical protein
VSSTGVKMKLYSLWCPDSNDDMSVKLHGTVEGLKQSNGLSELPYVFKVLFNQYILCRWAHMDRTRLLRILSEARFEYTAEAERLL